MKKVILYIDLLNCLFHSTSNILNIGWFHSNDVLTITAIAFLLVLIIGYFFTLFYSKIKVSSMKKAILYIDLLYCLFHSTYSILNIIWLHSNEVLTIMAIAFLLVLIIGYFFTLFKNDEMKIFFSYALFFTGLFSLIFLYFTLPFHLVSNLIILFIISFLIEVLFIAVLAKNSVFRNIFGTSMTKRRREIDNKTFWYGIITTILVGAIIIIFLLSNYVKYYSSYPPTP